MIEAYPISKPWKVEKFDGNNIEDIRALFRGTGIFVAEMYDSKALVAKNPDDFWWAYINVGQYVLRSPEGETKIISERQFKKDFYTK